MNAQKYPSVKCIIGYKLSGKHWSMYERVPIRMQCMSFLYRTSQVSLAMIEELRAVIKKQELEMQNLKEQLDTVVIN